MANRYGYIYLIVNKINGKTYVGQRKYNDIFSKDDYMGSGTHLKAAQKKYGIENFEKFLIQYCNSKEELDKQEIFWITEYRNRGKAEYNIAEGGRGGSHPSAWKNKTFEEYFGEEKALEYRKKLSEIKKGKSTWNKGKKLTKEHRKNLSEAHKGQSAWNKGKRGRFWYTNGIEDKVFYPNEVPEGWIKGRCKTKGRKQSEEEKQKRREAALKRTDYHSFKLTDEQKQKLSWAKKEYYGSLK